MSRKTRCYADPLPQPLLRRAVVTQIGVTQIGASRVALLTRLGRGTRAARVASCSPRKPQRTGGATSGGQPAVAPHLAQGQHGHLRVDPVRVVAREDVGNKQRDGQRDGQRHLAAVRHVDLYHARVR